MPHPSKQLWPLAGIISLRSAVGSPTLWLIDRRQRWKLECHLGEVPLSVETRLMALEQVVVVVICEMVL